LPAPPEMLVVGDHTMEGGMRAFGELMRLPTPPTAVFCSNDMTAIGVMREAYDLGIKVPHDLSVVGFDDIRLSEFTTPPLTTVRMSQTELARIAFQALMNDVTEEAASSGRKEYPLSTSLILRRSTALAAPHSVREKSSTS
jgi:DNA-binding LacI/PurR family transcriptional regulator